MRATADNPLHGRTRNPWHPDASPGGSSGGARRTRRPRDEDPHGPSIRDRLGCPDALLCVASPSPRSGSWFENKKALVDWYYGDPHQKAQKTLFPDLTFDRKPLPDLADDSGPILTIVSVGFVDTPKPNTIASIGIELYGPLPGGVAVGGRFAPEGLKVRGLREIQLGTAPPR